MAADRDRHFERPNPSNSHSPQEFIDELARLKIIAGHTYKDLQGRTGIPRSTLGDVLAGKRRPRQEVVRQIVGVYAHDDAQIEAWMATWSRLTLGTHDDSPRNPSTLVVRQASIGHRADIDHEERPRTSEWSIVPSPSILTYDPLFGPRRRRAILGVTMTLCLLTVVGLTAGAFARKTHRPTGKDQAAAASQVQAQIDRQLLQVGGGQQINSHEVAYDDGKFVIGFDRPRHRDAAPTDCPDDWICFYQNKDFGWPRARLNSCGWYDLGWWDWNDTVRSVRNNTRSELKFTNHDDHFNPTNGHRFDKLLFTMTAAQQLAAVPGTPEPPNQADHVTRSCRR